MPRIVGVSTAFDLISSGRMISASEAHKMGIVDDVHQQEETDIESMLDVAEKFALSDIVQKGTM